MRWTFPWKPLDGTKVLLCYLSLLQYFYKMISSIIFSRGIKDIKNMNTCLIYVSWKSWFGSPKRDGWKDQTPANLNSVGFLPPKLLTMRGHKSQTNETLKGNFLCAQRLPWQHVHVIHSSLKGFTFQFPSLYPETCLWRSKTGAPPTENPPPFSSQLFCKAFLWTKIKWK